MAQRPALTVTERESIYDGKLNHQHLLTLADAQQCSYSCARKWWRRGRDRGRDALRQTQRQSAPAPGLLSQFDPKVAERARYWKGQHPKRGPNRILHDLATDPLLQGLALPKRATLAAYFHQVCPELLQPHQPAPAKPTPVGTVHERWQLDGKENLRLGDGTIATTLDLREPVACVFLGSQAHAVQTAKGWRKLTLPETQADLRLAFTRYGLPASLQTDRERLYGQPPEEAFPTNFTLWLVGLGIQHVFSRPHQPTDQPTVERGHRTLCDWMAAPEPWANLPQLQADLDQACHLHNAVLPSQAGDCQGRIPLQVHPEVLQPQRPYHPSAELALFSLTRIDHFLAQFVWHHKVTPSGQAFVRDQAVYLGPARAGQCVEVRFDPSDRQLVFRHAQTGQELKRCPLRGLDVATLTGLPMPASDRTPPVQLSFPWPGYGSD